MSDTGDSIVGASPVLFWRRCQPDALRNRVDFTKYRALLSFIHRIHVDKRAAFTEAILVDRNTIADQAASAVAHLQDGGYVSDALFRDALDYCHDILLDRGYAFSTADEVASVRYGPSVMMLAGCQDRPMLRARVEAAYSTVRRLGVPFRLVFSGLNPDARSPGAAVRTVNEAREMQAYFFALRDRDPKGRLVEVEPLPRLDEDATNTIANVTNFLSERFLFAEPSEVFLVSSTFHLVRLAEKVDNRLSEDPSLSVARVVLVGAESNFTSPVIPTPTRYLKSMLHDLYMHALAPPSGQDGIRAT